MGGQCWISLERIHRMTIIDAQGRGRRLEWVEPNEKGEGSESIRR